MFVRKFALCVVLFCFVSIFVGVPFAEAHPSKESEKAVKKAEQSRDNAWDEQLEQLKRYNGAEKAVTTLLAAWDANAESIKSNKWDVFNTVTATAIAVVLDVVLTNKSGDGGAMKTDWLKELVESSPAFLSAINAGKEIGDLINDLSAREAYLLALNSAVSALDKIISENKAAFDLRIW